MALLSTSSHLIKISQDYSAGENISIVGNVINSKDWTDDISNASANAYNAATAQVDNKLDTTAFTNWQDGQYNTDLQTIESQIANKLDVSSFSDVSASFLTAINIPESATWDETSNVIQSNSAQWNKDESVPVSNSGDFYKVEFDGVDLYGYKSTTNIPNYVYSAVSSQQNTYIQYTNYPQWDNPAIQGLNHWSGFDIISISSNGNKIYSSSYGDNRLTALDVYYRASNVRDLSDQPLPDFSGYIGKITLDNLVTSSYYDKPSYFNNIERITEFRLWFSANNSPEGGIESNYLCSVGNEVQSGTNTIDGIIVPSEPDLSNYIPYTTTGMELPNSHFKVDTDGRAYKLEVVNSAEQTLTTANFSANNTLSYSFGRNKHYVVQVPLTRNSFEVREAPYGTSIGSIICSGVVQDGICDFVYPSSGATGRKWFVTNNIYGAATLTTANCKLYSLTTSPSGEYVLASDLDYISASYDSLYSAFTAYTASHP